MPADFTGTFQNVYAVRLNPSEPVQLQWIKGGELPVKLSLAIRDDASIKHALATPESDEAILALHMRWEEMREIYSAIEDMAARTGLPLPTKDEG
jgi:hypothetical protein